MAEQLVDEDGYPTEPLGRLRFWAEMQQRLDDSIADEVDAARRAGHGWTEIGEALWLTAEGARIRQVRRHARLAVDSSRHGLAGVAEAL